jgi:RND family efflux transporter MFP subunit
MCWTKMTAAAVLAVLAGCGSPEAPRPAGTEAAGAPVQVAAAAAAETEWPDTVEAPGTVRPRSAAVLSSRAMGYLRELRYREGDRVEAGAVVAVLEARELAVAAQQARTAVEEARAALPEAESAVASAAAQLNLAETTLRRMQDLLAKRSVSQQEFDEAEARMRVAAAARQAAEAKRVQIERRIRQAEEAVAAAEVQLAYLEVKAPFAGRVTARRAEPGMLVSPGMPLLEVESEGGYRLEVAVPEAHLRAVRMGQTAEIRLGSSSAALAARVEEIVPEVDAASRSFVVKLALPAQAEVRSGLFGRALFRTGSRRVLTIPRAAVLEQGQLRSVFVVDAGAARMRMVRLGEERDGAVEVLSGLTPGELVIAPPPAGLADGQRVEVAP